MATPKKFYFTTHSKARSSERDFTESEAKNAVKYPTKKERLRKGTHGGICYKFIKDLGDNTLVIVAEVKKTDCWILTGFWK